MKLRLTAATDRSGPARGEAAISLVEVVLALGILSFAAVPMMALMASGFNGYRSAMDRAAESAIIQRIRGDAARLATAGGALPVSYYSEEGIPTPAADARALYRVDHVSDQGTIRDPAAPATLLPRTVVSRYTITHLPSGAVHATGFVHITRR